MARAGVDDGSMPNGTDRILRWFWPLQAVAVTGWWVVLWTVPATRSWFGFGAWPEGVLMAFALPDAVLLVAGSAMTACAEGRRRMVLAWLVAGGCCYALLWCLAASLATGGGWLGGAAMALLALGNLAAARATGRRAEG
jgi:hypothetical protein